MILLGALMGLGAAAALVPAPDLARLQEARNVGLASLEQGDLAEAQKRFDAVRKLAPADPLGWADGAVAALRAGDPANLAAAATLMAEALRVAPANAKVVALEGVRREQAKDAAGALSFYDKAVALDPKDLVSRWSAARLRSASDASTGTGTEVPIVRGRSGIWRRRSSRRPPTSSCCCASPSFPAARATDRRPRPYPGGSRGSSPKTRRSPARSRTLRPRATPGTARRRTSSSGSSRTSCA